VRSAISPARLRRTFLYVPGVEERKIAKAQTLGADAVILDLEDSVAAERKGEARERVRTFLSGQPNPAVEWLVRVNALSSPHFEADLACGVAARPDGLVVPKVERPEALREVDARLTEAERGAGQSVGSLKVFAMIESARAVLDAHAIAVATPRLQGLILGHVDLLRDLGLAPGPAGEGTVHHARCHLVLAARAAGTDAVDAIHLNIQDHGALRAEAVQAAGMGFVGKQVIHPGQIPVVHGAFSPSAERVQRAERVLEAWRKAQAEGKGVVALDGELLEPPVVAMETRILERARQAHRHDEGK
jgi:citrate lyase subunit beta / citryl-CoA lyase